MSHSLIVSKQQTFVKACSYVQSLNAAEKANYLCGNQSMLEFAVNAEISASIVEQHKDIIEAILLGRVFYFDTPSE
ncbi:hypothetical protein ACGRH2_25900 [Vibrio barjaei]|uniref:Transcriptional regulator n=1 Tax=Vibrio barjaei TaxID=1676683 RepID=A0ABW7IQB2_9VIBR